MCSANFSFSLYSKVCFLHLIRDVGTAYVFATDTVASLLNALPVEDFHSHLDGLQRMLGWFEEHWAVEVIPGYCNPMTGQCYGKPLCGWASPHMSAQSSTPVAWSTTQMLTRVVRMRKVVQRLIHINVLKELRGESNDSAPKLPSWDRLLNRDLGDPSMLNHWTLKVVLNVRMIKPFSATIPITGCVFPSQPHLFCHSAWSSQHGQDDHVQVACGAHGVGLRHGRYLKISQRWAYQCRIQNQVLVGPPPIVDQLRDSVQQDQRILP